MNWVSFPTPVSRREDTDFMVVGRLLRTAEGHVTLVGDINELGGLCDDCSDFTTWVAYSDDLLPLIAGASRGSEQVVRKDNPHAWIGVDLDGTFAVYDEWKGITHIGQPIPEMVERVRGWLAAGKNVRIFTARLSSGLGGQRDLDYDAFREAMSKWCLEHVGQDLPVTNVKDYDMIELWDDRAVQVEFNTGRVIGYSLWGNDR